MGNIPVDGAIEGQSVLQKRAGIVWLIFAVVGLMLCAAVFAAAGKTGMTRALSLLEIQTRNDANLKVALLRAVLERPRALPLVLSQDSELREALVTVSQENVERLDRKLEDLVGGTQVSVIYVIGIDGIAIASSNWREPLSFVGNDYSFRDYFQKAIREGIAEHYALGSVSKRPGLYISRRVDAPDGRPVGVVVVKVEFDQLEQDWRSTGKPVYVTDTKGIVLLTSIPSWRYMASGPVPPAERQAIRDSLQFGDAPLSPLPFKPGPVVSETSTVAGVIMPGDSGQEEYLNVVTDVPTTAWQLHHLAPLDPTVMSGIRESRLLAFAVLLPLLALVALLLWRRQMAGRRIAGEKAARIELERRVIARTSDLTLARDRLQSEIEDHRKTESRLQSVQEDLVQANRLAILGQVAAGVAHEINQPVATIRAYADNARVFLGRAQLAPVDENLENIAGLTERIGSITEELRAFARKGRGATGPTSLRDVIEGAVVLLRSRFSGRMDSLDIALPPADVLVIGNRIRLEQVLINLLQNALEAIGAHDDGRVAVGTHVRGTEVSLTVSDNGPGIPAHIRDALFIPFNTSKEKGLGLGLVISKEIVADYGGRIDVDSDTTGTRFTVHLKKA